MWNYKIAMATFLVCRSVASWGKTIETVTVEEVLRNKKKQQKSLNAWKSTINWVRVSKKWRDENRHEKKLEMILLEHLDKVIERFYASVDGGKETTLTRQPVESSFSR